jgi:hypothetical protein
MNALAHLKSTISSLATDVMDTAADLEVRRSQELRAFEG